jgi:hypothetical protein
MSIEASVEAEDAANRMLAKDDSLLIFQRSSRVPENKLMRCAAHVVISATFSRSSLGAFSAAAWLILSATTLGYPLYHVCAQMMYANVCLRVVPASRELALFSDEGRQCSGPGRQLCRSELRSGLLTHYQRRNEAYSACSGADTLAGFKV